jgi:hypothetical protein
MADKTSPINSRTARKVAILLFLSGRGSKANPCVTLDMHGDVLEYDIELKCIASID